MAEEAFVNFEFFTHNEDFGWIIGVVLGCVLTPVIIIIVVCCCKKCKREALEKERKQKEKKAKKLGPDAPLEDTQKVSQPFVGG